MDLPSKEQALGPCCVVRQVAAELSAALFFWDSLFSRVPFPSEILRRHTEMLCHRRLIRLPEPALRETKRKKNTNNQSRNANAANNNNSTFQTHL